MAQENITKREEKRLRQEELNDLCAIMDIPQGRRFIGRVLAKGRLYQTSFAGQSNQTVFNEGMRNMALWVFTELNDACPEKILEMMQEHHNREKENG